MKLMSRVTIVLVLALAAFAVMTSVALAASRLVYSDEFNGQLDTASWATLTPWNTHTDSIQLAYYDPANASVANGSLCITSQSRPTNGCAYASAFLTSSARPKFSYGYFEIRAKLPKGPGIWPAFWLTNDSTLEIDGLEALGDRPTRIYQTLHENDSQIYQGVTDGPDYSADFHTYGLDWQPTYLKWYIDGVLTATYNHAMPADPMYICLNTAVGGAWPGQPTAATTFPVDYDIDYVRVYDTKPVSGTTVTTPVPVTDPPGKTSVYRFRNLTNGSYFYTADSAEMVNVASNLTASYAYEGVAYTIDTANPANASPVYRFYVKRTGSHFYTADKAERDSVIANLAATYTYEGPSYNVCLAPVSGSTIVWRFYNKQNGSHFYTADPTEKANVQAHLSATYSFDGPAFYLAP